MRNRAKCDECNEIIESLAVADIVSCGCGCITIWGGLSELRSSAKDYSKFLRVDDEGNERRVRFVESHFDGENNGSDKDVSKGDETNPEDDHNRDPLNEAIQMMQASLNAFENLPDHGKFAPVNQFDHNKLIIITLGAVKALSALLLETREELGERIEECDQGDTDTHDLLMGAEGRIGSLEDRLDLIDERTTRTV